MPGTPLVAEHVGRRYRRTRPWAVRDLSLVVPEGSITALVGPNGAGKSTLIRAALGFERPDEGRLLVFGVDPRRDRTRVVNSLGYVPQGPSLYRNLTIADHLTLARAARSSFDRSYAHARIRGAGPPRTGRSPTCLAASRRRSRSPWRSVPGRRCSCSTSRWPVSIRSPAVTS